MYVTHMLWLERERSAKTHVGCTSLRPLARPEAVARDAALAIFVPITCSLSHKSLIPSKISCERRSEPVRMACRQSESSLDATIRSIWEDGYSPSKTYNSLSSNKTNFASANGPQRTYGGLPIPGATSDRRCSTNFGPVGSPMRKKSLGAYDCSNGPFMSNSNSGGCCYESKRSPAPSLWDCSSGYSSGEQSALFSSGSFSDNSLDLSPPMRNSSLSLYESLEQLNASETDSEKEQLDLIAKAISSLLMTRGNSINHRVDTIKELFSLTAGGCRRASVACSGGHFLERERHLNAAIHQRNQFRNEFGRSNHSAYPSYFGGGGGSYSNYSNMQQSSNDIVLEQIECEAKRRRTSAYQSETTLSWKGTLTTRFHASPTFAPKVFVGGLPYDVTPDALSELFGKFGLVTVQFPPRGRGHAYLVFDSEQQVQALLNACENKGPGQYFYWVSSRRGKDRHAQVIPWAIEDSDWVMPTESSCDSSRSTSSSSSNTDSVESLSDSESGKNDSTPRSNDSKRSQPYNNAYKGNTVFVGALHGEITAEGLQKILSDLFGPVAHVAIDCDKQRYPNGSGRATFVSRESFRRAVLAEFVQVVTTRFSKIIQLDAYIEDGVCSECKAATPIFCRHPSCFCYYCAMCFEKHRRGLPEYHPPVMRNRNNGFNVNSNSVHNINRTSRTKTL